MATVSVPKPASAGQGRTAFINTRGSYVNVRTGPGTHYTDIGDIFNRTLVMYYPASAQNGWTWVEQHATAGWISTEVVTFDDAPQMLYNHPPTPYDGRVAVWHWKGEAVPETRIDEFVLNLRRYAPNLKQVWVKVGDGSTWQGNYDSGDMAIHGPSDVTRWVQTLERHGLEFHAWIVLKGRDIRGEAQIIKETCKQPGVKSMILDVEPFEHYWQVGPDPIRPLMVDVRREVGGDYHIGLSVDPRRQHYERIYPAEWFPFVNSVHPMCYWKSFRRDVQDVLEEAYQVWGGYGHPIIPILQGDATFYEHNEAREIVTSRYGAKGMSWWRYGTIAQWGSINRPIVVDGSEPSDPVEPPPPGTQYGEEVVVFAGQDGFRSGSYTGKEEFMPFTGAVDWPAYYTSTEPRSSKVWAEWKADLPKSGNYQISVFVPARHSTTKKARYKIHGIRGTDTEVIVDLNQSIHRNEWVPLGVFDLVRGAANAGKVFLNDVTGETGKEIAFDAVRLREIVVLPDDPVEVPEDKPLPEIISGVYVADGYDSPVGSQAERHGSLLWPSGWLDASPFGKLYFIGTWREAYHTGADLNWGKPYEDRGLPTYACASGIVTFAGRLKTWGNVIVIRHDPLRSPTGRVFYSRYAHVQKIAVKAGQRVRRGELIAEIGDAFGTLVPHLHFDLSPTSKLERNPADWPGKDASRLFRDYIDPLLFIRANRP